MVDLASNGRSLGRARIHARGKISAIIAATAGFHRYRVRCLAEGRPTRTLLSGTLSVRSDSGARPLPKGTPENLVSADGRTYTVLYQNRLPRLAFAWMDAPPAAGYQLFIANGSLERRIRARSRG